MPNTKTKDGHVSAYGFLCGHIEVYEKDKIRLTLSQEGGVNFYDVKGFNHKNGKRLFWTQIKSLKKARKCFLAAKRRWCNYPY